MIVSPRVHDALIAVRDVVAIEAAAGVARHLPREVEARVDVVARAGAKRQQRCRHRSPCVARVSRCRDRIRPADVDVGVRQRTALVRCRTCRTSGSSARVLLIHLSGIMNGLTHVMALAADASAVAVAVMSTLSRRRRSGPSASPTGVQFRRGAVDLHLHAVGSASRIEREGDVSGGDVDGAPMTLFFVAALIAL